MALVGDTALLSVGDEFSKGVLETKLRDLITSGLGRILGQEVRIAVTVSAAKPTPAQMAPRLPFAPSQDDRLAADPEGSAQPISGQPPIPPPTRSPEFADGARAHEDSANRPAPRPEP